MDWDEMRSAYLRANGAENDVVERLRYYYRNFKPWSVFEDAAQEIEELRATVRELRSEVQRLGSPR